MSGLTEIMDELAATLRSALGANVEQVIPRMAWNPTPPTIDIYPDTPSRDTDTAGFGDVFGGYRFIVRARVSTADDESGQDVLLALMDDEDELCVAAALEADQTLNGLAGSVAVTDISGFGEQRNTENSGSLLGVIWNVTVVNWRT